MSRELDDLLSAGRRDVEHIVVQTEGDAVGEPVELVQQFGRTRGRVDPPDAAVVVSTPPRRVGDVQHAVGTEAEVVRCERLGGQVPEVAIGLDDLNARGGRDGLVAVAPLTADHPVAAVLCDVDPVVRVTHGAVGSAADDGERLVHAGCVEPMDDALVDRDEDDLAGGRDDWPLAEARSAGDHSGGERHDAAATGVRDAQCGSVTPSGTGSAGVPSTLRIIASAE